MIFKFTAARPHARRHGLALVIGGWLLILGAGCATNRPPPEPERMVLAHRMMGFGPQFSAYGHGPYDCVFPVKGTNGLDATGYGREGHIGALHTPFSNSVAACTWEIGQALEGGVEGFVLDTCGGVRDLGIPGDMIKAAADLGGRFKVGLCLDFAGGSITAKVASVHEWITRHADNPSLLRRHGLPVFFTYGSGYCPTGDVSRYFSELRAAAGQPIYLVVDLSEFPNRPPEEWETAARAYLPYADGVSVFYSRQKAERNAQCFAALAKTCHAMGKDWILCPWPNYYASARRHGVENIGADNSRLWDRMWRMARDTQADMVSITTWNDISEDTTVMPGLRRHFTFMDLTGRYYVPWFKTGREPRPTHDQLFVFYRPYRTDAAPPLVVGPRAPSSASQDFVEVRAFLTKPGRVVVEGMGAQDVPRGMSSVEFPSRPGPVKVALERRGRTVLSFQAPEYITDRPWRQDFAIRGFSSEEPAHWAKWFPEQPPHYVSEYGDDDVNGLPNWFEHYYFGQWTGIDPQADPDGDGQSNLQEYLAGTDPRHLPPVYPDGYCWDAVRDFRPGDETYPIPDDREAQVWTFEFLSTRERTGRFMPAGPLVAQIPAWLERGNSWSFGIGRPVDGALRYSGEGDSASSQVWSSPLTGRFAVRLAVRRDTPKVPLTVTLTREGPARPVETLWTADLPSDATPLALDREISVRRGDRLRLAVSGRSGQPRWSSFVSWSVTYHLGLQK